MEKNLKRYRAYVRILEEELVPAMGCTEPIALAYCAAKAREVLGILPERCVVEASGNIVKNVKSVIVPNTGGLKGIEAAAAAGVVAGDAGRFHAGAGVPVSLQTGAEGYRAGGLSYDRQQEAIVRAGAHRSWKDHVGSFSGHTRHRGGLR